MRVPEKELVRENGFFLNLVADNETDRRPYACRTMWTMAKVEVLL
jgi:hypothetical protein